MKRLAPSRLRTMKLYSRGLALIELMIAMVLGLVIIGAVTGIMLSNIQGFRTNTGLSQIQDSARVGYELLARDIRQAANVPCGNDIPVVNILNSAQGPAANVPWQYDFNNAFVGFDGDDELNGVDNQIAGTEFIVMLSGEASDSYMEDYDTNSNSSNFAVATAGGSAHDFAAGDILMACNERQATIFQVTNAQANSNRLVANTGGSQTPGNCTKGFGPIEPGNGNQLCDTNGTPGPYGPNTVLARLNSTAWYIGDNERPGEGGRSLYMARLDVSGGNAAVIPIEIAAGVNEMNLRYRLVDTADFIDAATVGNRWADVNAVEVTLELLSQDQNISTDNSVEQGRLGRGFTSVIAIRNRSL